MRTPTPVGHAEVTHSTLKELARPLESTFSRSPLTDAGHHEVATWLTHVSVLSQLPHAGRARTSPERRSGWDVAIEQIVEDLEQAYLDATPPAIVGMVSTSRQRWAENVCSRLVNEAYRAHRSGLLPCVQADLDVLEASDRLPADWLQALPGEGSGLRHTTIATARGTLLEALRQVTDWDLQQPAQLVRIYMSDEISRIAAHVGAYAHVEDATYASEVVLATSPLVVSYLIANRNLGAKPSSHIGAVHPNVDRLAAVTMAAALTVEMPDSRLLETVNGLLS